MKKTLESIFQIGVMSLALIASPATSMADESATQKTTQPLDTETILEAIGEASRCIDDD